MQGVSAFKGPKGPFLFGAMGPSPPGPLPSGVRRGRGFSASANACDAQYFVINAAICNRASILIICSNNVFEIHRVTESLIGFSHRATNSIYI